MRNLSPRFLKGAALSLRWTERRNSSSLIRRSNAPMWPGPLLEATNQIEAHRQQFASPRPAGSVGRVPTIGRLIARISNQWSALTDSGMEARWDAGVKGVLESEGELEEDGLGVGAAKEGKADRQPLNVSRGDGDVRVAGHSGGRGTAADVAVAINQVGDTGWTARG